MKVTCQESGIEFESQDGWISAKDYFPPISQHVLTYEKNARMPIKINYIRNYEYTWAYGQQEDITHWHTLPEAPT